jgi:hypothetical protein
VKSLLIPDSPHVSQWVDLVQKERANRNDECLLVAVSSVAECHQFDRYRGRSGHDSDMGNPALLTQLGSWAVKFAALR